MRKAILSYLLVGPFSVFGVLVLLLMSLLFGCSLFKPEYRVVVLEPPAVLLQDNQVPSKEGVSTNADLLEYCVDLEAVVEDGNADKAAVREWVSETKKSVEGE